ncbi:MAG: hypothetical protein EVB11_05010 [Winogradskyella sp.]|nr:MAG: hypothetical protein EVB11_05010 [Winogradskyella sp.]
MNKEQLNNFDFLDEISKGKTYSLLFPVEEDGIVIAQLYENVLLGIYEDEQFTGEDIHNIYKNIQGYTTGGDKRYLKDKIGERIKNLQRYFLSYDETIQKYALQEYAKQFCRIAKQTLKGSFDPTEIQKICSRLRKALDKAIKGENTLIDWFEYDFDPFKEDLKVQIEYLYRQIDDSVKKLREDSYIKNLEPLELLKTVSDDLAIIQEKNEDLRSAYDETDAMTSQLIDLDSTNDTIVKRISSTTYFFRTIRGRLKTTDNKLNRIRPRIKELFSSLNKPEFNAKTERFIDFLLEESSLDSDKNVVFPEGIQSLIKYEERARLVLLDRDRELFPLKAKKRIAYERDEDAEKLNQVALSTIIKESNLVKELTDKVFGKLENKKTVNMVKEFEEIYNTNSDFTVASKVYFGCIERAHTNPKIKVTIQKENLRTISSTNITLWDTIFQM